MTQLPSTPPRPRTHVGRLLFGVALAALGVLWLLEALDVATIDWDLALPVAAIAVGAGLLVAGFAGRGSGGLVALGIALTVLLAASTVVEIPLGSGVGDRTYRPLNPPDRAYELAIGKLTVDLTRMQQRTSVPLEIRVSARAGIGQLLVLVPEVLPCVFTHAKAGIGKVRVFGREQGGFAAEYRTDVVCSAAPLLRLDLSVGIGQVEVRRG